MHGTVLEGCRASIARLWLTGMTSLVLVAACSTDATDEGASVAPDVPAASVAASAAASRAAAATTIIEDAGVETALPAGTYESRLFRPALTLELGDGWYRRDANGDRTLNLRRANDLAEDVTFISGIDYLQCGTDAVIDAPSVDAMIAAIGASPSLGVSDPIEVAVGDRTATAIRLAGGGAPVSDADFGRLNEFGCVMSMGEAPFPAESLWITATPDAPMQLVAADIDGTTLLVRTRPGDTTTDVDALYDLTLQLLADAHLG